MSFRILFIGMQRGVERLNALLFKQYANMSFTRDNSLFTILQKHLRVGLTGSSAHALLLVWMEQRVEQIMDRLWQTSPSRAFAVHEQIIHLLALHVRRYLPEMHTHSCAPVPRVPKALSQYLVKMQLLNERTGLSSRQYAVITHWPWKGGCGQCALASNCHRKNISETNSFFSNMDLVII